jgi:hypothetical protein
MQPQAFLDGFRSARGMGMANTRNRFDRSADQDQTQSGNPGTIYNQANFRGRSPSFHQQDAFANAQQALGQVPAGGAQGFAARGGADSAAVMMGGRFPMARTRGGMPGQIGQGMVDQNAVNADPQGYAEYLARAAQEAPDSAFGQIALASGFGRTRPGMPPQVAQMPPEQPAPYVAPNPGRTFNAPRFNTNTMFRGRQMWQ